MTYYKILCQPIWTVYDLFIELSANYNVKMILNTFLNWFNMTKYDQLNTHVI